VVSRPEDEFIVNPEAVAQAITPRTRLILIGSPSNPTGAVYDEKTLRALADLAVKHDIWLLTDDIYRSLCYGDARFVQPATFSPEVRKRTIIVDGVSKTFAMTRVAYRILRGASARHRRHVDPARGNPPPTRPRSARRQRWRRWKDRPTNWSACGWSSTSDASSW